MVLRAWSRSASPSVRRLLLQAAVCLVAVTCSAPLAEARIHELTIHGDNRAAFHIESFGFNEGGIAHMQVKSFGLASSSNSVDSSAKVGFVIRKVASESDAVAQVEEAQETGTCLLSETDDDQDLPGLTWIAPSDPKDWSSGWDHEHTIEHGEEGMYQVIFARCAPEEGTVSFDITLSFYNMDGDTRNYLSAGDSALPTIYFATAFSFCALVVAWIYICRRDRENVHHIHRLMLVLVVLKTMSLLSHSISYHFIKLHGHPVGWNVIYYIFTFLKGVMLFLVILLVGTGWSLLKPYLNEREKRILLIVLPLQVVANIALVVIEETSPGSVAWLSWSDVLHLVDILCCCLVLFPIVWQIRHLRQTAAVDGKAALNLRKLTQYRNFYMVVVGWIYFTRIIVYLVGATVPYNLTWMKAFFEEVAAISFFAWTGYRFRPASNNPYLPVRGDDDMDDDMDDEDDFALGDSDFDATVELSVMKSGKQRSDVV